MSRAYLIAWMLILVLPLSGCLGSEDDPDTNEESLDGLVFSFKTCFVQIESLGVYISGCPRLIDEWDFPQGGQANVAFPINATGIYLAISTSAVGGEATITIDANGTVFDTRLLAGASTYENYHPRYSTNYTSGGQDHNLIGSICDVEELNISVDVKNLDYQFLSLRLYAYDPGIHLEPRTEEMPGPSCNNYWEGTPMDPLTEGRFAGIEGELI